VNVEFGIGNIYNNVYMDINIGGKYHHFKGGEYKVIGIAKHSETLEEMVVYESLDRAHLWVRPKAMFLDVIERDGKTMTRFTEL